MADESLEELVIRRIRQQLGEEGFQRLIANQPPMVGANFGGSGHLEVTVTATGTGVVTTTAEGVAVLEKTSPQLAEDVKGRSPQEITQVVNLVTALMALLTAIITAYNLCHQQPPTPEQITQFFNQVTNIVINPPPTGR